ncbi:MAG: tRNA pseudouridine(38-40) synthase TruA [Chloroflexota bacterium]
MNGTLCQLEAAQGIPPATGTRIVLTVEYEGTRYCGSQLQADAPTIQGELEAALLKLTGERIRVSSASRTDAGVHARGQVVSFTATSALPFTTFISGLNYYLPDDIAVKAAARAGDKLDVRRSALSREYHYYILNSPTRSPISQRFCHRVSGRLDTGAMNRALSELIGRQDFASFMTGTGSAVKSTVRDMHHAGIEQEVDRLTLKMVANSFLPHQVRNTVGAVIRVGLDKMSVEDFRAILQAKKPGLAGPTAPACGLCLMRINYASPLGERDNENF